mgnify:CR=1 FL=1|jgi:hypothetical protein
MAELRVEDLKNSKEIRFNVEVPYDINSKTNESMVNFVNNSNVLKIVYPELTKEEIEQIFLGITKFQSIIKANDLLDIISEMSETSFKDLEFEQLDKNQHHGRKAKADIQREKELQIKDLEGPTVTGPSGPGR